MTKDSRAAKVEPQTVRFFHVAETIKSITPIVLAITGGAIALCSIFSPNITSEKFVASMGVAGTFGAAAAGLASPQKDRS